MHLVSLFWMIKLKVLESDQHKNLRFLWIDLNESRFLKEQLLNQKISIWNREPHGLLRI